MKVDEQPSLQPAEPAVGDDLSFVNQKKSFDSLDLDDELTQALLIRRLEQTGAQMTMDLDVRPDHELRTILKTSRLPGFLLHPS